MSRQELQEMLKWCRSADYEGFQKVSIDTEELLWLLETVLGE